MQNNSEKLLTSDRKATFFRAVWLQLAVISLLTSCWVPSVSTAHLTHSNSAVEVTANARWLSGTVLVWASSLRWCTKLVLTYKLLLMALVSHFSLDQIDTINLYSMAQCLLDLWTQANPCNCRCLWALVPSGVSVSQLSTYHFNFERLKYQVMPPSSLEGNTVIFMGCDLQKVMMQM